MPAYLLLRCGANLYGVPLGQVFLVSESARPIPAPARHPAVRGLARVAGRWLPQVHLEALLRQQEPPAPLGSTVVVAGPPEAPVALEVDETDLARLDDPLPVPPQWTGPSAVGLARHGEQVVPILDLPGLLARLHGPAEGET